MEFFRIDSKDSTSELQLGLDFGEKLYKCLKSEPLKLRSSLCQTEKAPGVLVLVKAR